MYLMDAGDVPTFAGSDDYVDSVRQCVQLQIDELQLLQDLYGPDARPAMAAVSVTNPGAVEELGDVAAAMEGLSKSATRRAAASLLAVATLPLIELELPLELSPENQPASPAGGGGMRISGYKRTLRFRVKIPRGYPLLTPPTAAITAGVELLSASAQGRTDSVIEAGVLRVWANTQKGPCLCELVEWAMTELPGLLTKQPDPDPEPEQPESEPEQPEQREQPEQPEPQPELEPESQPEPELDNPGGNAWSSDVAACRAAED